jgi:hypothetical protein
LSFWNDQRSVRARKQPLRKPLRQIGGECDDSRTLRKERQDKSTAGKTIIGPLLTALQQNESDRDERAKPEQK